MAIKFSQLSATQSYRCFATLGFLLPALIFVRVGFCDEYKTRRSALVDLIEREVQMTRMYLDEEKVDSRVMAAIDKVPRHEFVPPDEISFAYENRPLPIGHGQTISQPYIVAVMTDLLKPRPEHRVLEVGTGSAYQAAVLAELVKEVYSMEIIEELGREGEQRLARLGYANVFTRVGDGYHGWAEAAPFDGIIVTAAASHVPPPLIRQLKPGGRMIIPVGSRFMIQQLLLLEKDQNDRVTTKQLLPVRFVPLTGQH